jgi:3-methyladenine DNA glycosylase/8-oxoguanine DNA glycosylase
VSGTQATGRPAQRALASLARRDPALGRALRRVPAFPGFPAAGGPRSHYEALAHAICFQQLATRAAQTIWGRACALTPGRGFPRAEELLGLEDELLRGAGLSGNKVLALRDLARRSLDGSLRLRGLHRLPDEEVVARLVEVRGIGPWSAQMFLLFRLGRLDVMAPGDLGLQEGLRRLDGLRERPGPRELEARAEAWRPLRSVACWVLWRLLDEGEA